MPIDKNGNRADVITDSTSTISRMNLGRTYESYLGATSRDNKQRLINYLCNKYKKPLDAILDKLKEEDITYIFNYLKGLYALINSDMSEFINSLNKEELVNHIREVLTDNMYIYYPIDNDRNIINVLDDIDKSIYKPLNDKVIYTDDAGNIVETVENIQVGNLYIMLLDKIANTYMAVSSAKVNNFSFPVKGTNTDKHRYPHALTPTKTLGETEVRILASYMGGHGVSELIDLTSNPISHKLLVKNILDSNNPINNNSPINRDIVPYGQTKPLMIFKHILNSAGFDYEYKKEEV
ncbi:MAG: hypothetical protein ACD_33C00002G0035 [uncultured bacterium]|nr:MAG: hypothetical protein ACD_33C00002G0035 [uncultured bacterium]